MRDIVVNIIVIMASLIIAAVSDAVLVHFGHPESVWLWCTMFGLC